jgi:hypothetical protein
MILVWFKDGCRCRLTSNSLTGHRKCLIGPSPRECGVRRREQCMKPGMSSLPETAMSYGALCQMCGMKLLHLSYTFDHLLSPWQDKWNLWLNHRSSGLLIREAGIWKQPLSGLNYSHFLCVHEIQKSLNGACFAHNLTTASISKWVARTEMDPMGPISVLANHENLWNKLNTTQRLHLINLNIWIDNFIKSIIRLSDEYLYFCVNWQLLVVNILATSTTI